MRILQIHRQFHPATGGIESVVAGLTGALQQAGHRSDIVTLRWLWQTREWLPPVATVEGVAVYRLPHLGIRRYPIAPGVFRFAPAYDLLHIHAIDFFIDFLAATRPLHGRPLVVSTHGGIFHTRWLLPMKKLFFQTITRLSLRQAAAVICDSPHDAALFRPLVPRVRLWTIPNGVNVAPLLQLEKQIEPGLLLAIGRLAANKHPEKLIRLLPALAEQCPTVRLVWAGADAEQRIPGLQALAQELGVVRRVAFVGNVPTAQLHKLLAQAQLYISASAYEAFGVATIEAMASGTVPVVPPVGIHTAVIEPGVNGWLYHPDAPNATSLIVAALATSPTALAEMGWRTRAAARQFAWEQVVQRYLAVYEGVLAEAAPGPLN